MDLAWVAAVEKLALEFQHLPIRTVIRVLSECADEFPNNDEQFLEQAARARLDAILQPEAIGGE